MAEETDCRARAGGQRAALWVRVGLGSVRGLRECVETSPASLNSEEGEGLSQRPLHAWETWITALPPGQHSPILGEEQGEE